MDEIVSSRCNVGDLVFEGVAFNVIRWKWDS